MTNDRPDEDAKAAWAAEIMRRAADAANPEDEEDWRSALADLREVVLSRLAVIRAQRRETSSR